ncbi:hypothetical protein [Sinisalibacter lacisalsi]|uniref:Sulfotransferase family protein n=1 Tax=Sinisalibacter lacisalsi TaxID=1526570 RepID=A0ABQ1QQC5_9RHOB|nr:hypothetical protein [Sinisalibacter lacisalsi]GGD38937.1 hypothetical protein GCM10011358_23560 [Sinisalibacter lacisalsi]
MIICHPLRIIFIKTKKVGGTSFEIALSGFCGPDCVITPLVAPDEALRARLGHRGAQNFENTAWPDGSRSPGRFAAHSTAAEVRAAVPAAIWRGYRKVTIWRDPFDALISRYHWRGGDRKGLSFNDFVLRNRGLIAVNPAIAPLSGPDRLDTYLRYERLAEDMADAGLGEVWQAMEGVRAKAGVRPPEATVEAVYAEAPEAARLVAELCAEEIAAFGYAVPG